MIDSQFLHAILQGLEVAEVAGLHACQPRPDSCPGLHVAQCCKPFVKRRPLIGRQVGPQLDHFSHLAGIVRALGASVPEAGAKAMRYGVDFHPAQHSGQAHVRQHAATGRRETTGRNEFG